MIDKMHRRQQTPKTDTGLSSNEQEK